MNWTTTRNQFAPDRATNNIKVDSFSLAKMINFKKKNLENLEEIRDSALPPRAPAPEMLQCWVGSPRWVPLPLPRNLKKKIPKTKEKET